jgi:hypothetical protein
MKLFLSGATGRTGRPALARTQPGSWGIELGDAAQAGVPFVRGGKIGHKGRCPAAAHLCFRFRCI